MYVYIYVYIFIYLYVHIYIYIYVLYIFIKLISKPKNAAGLEVFMNGPPASNLIVNFHGINMKGYTYLY
jgi:hypothetical protein